MFRRATLLCLAALTAAGTLSGAARADHRRLPPPPPDYVEEYTGPPILRYIPGVRILFGDYALTEDEYNQLYGQRRHRHFDESYYEPAPAPAPRAKRVSPPPSKKPASATSSASTGQQPAQKTASAAAAKPAAAGALSCEKATSVISGYGFSSVEAASCSGKSYAFNATRDGKKFAIKLDPASGELTEVKKLP